MIGEDPGRCPGKSDAHVARDKLRSFLRCKRPVARYRAIDRDRGSTACGTRRPCEVAQLHQIHQRIVERADFGLGGSRCCFKLGKEIAADRQDARRKRRIALVDGLCQFGVDRRAQRNQRSIAGIKIGKHGLQRVRAEAGRNIFHLRKRRIDDRSLLAHALHAARRVGRGQRQRSRAVATLAAEGQQRLEQGLVELRIGGDLAIIGVCGMRSQKLAGHQSGQPG